MSVVVIIVSVHPQHSTASTISSAWGRAVRMVGWRVMLRIDLRGRFAPDQHLGSRQQRRAVVAGGDAGKGYEGEGHCLFSSSMHAKNKLSICRLVYPIHVLRFLTNHSLRESLSPQ